LDLLQKNSLVFSAVFFKNTSFFSCLSLVFLKRCSLKSLRHIAFFLVLLSVPPVFDRPVFSEIFPEDSAQHLKNLNLRVFKRELRLPEAITSAKSPHYAALHKGYRNNHFQDIVTEIKLLPVEQQDGNILILYGNSLLILGQESQAISAFQSAFQKAKHPKIKSAAMANFALVYSMSMRWKEAVQWLEKALELDREIDDWRAQGLALSQLGAFYFKLGHAEKGAAAHIEALEIAETVPIPWLEARQLGQLASLYYRDKALPLAKDYYQQALKIYKTLDDPLSEMGLYSALSFVYKDLGDFDTALQLQLQALSGYQKLQDQGNRSKIWLNLSLLYRDEGRYQEALHAAEEALHLQTSLKNLKKLAEIEGTIGTIYEKKGEFSKALHHLKKARVHFEKTGASQEIHIVDLRIQTLEDRMP